MGRVGAQAGQGGVPGPPQEGNKGQNSAETYLEEVTGATSGLCSPKHQHKGLVSEMHVQLWKTPVLALRGWKGLCRGSCTPEQPDCPPGPLCSRERSPGEGAAAPDPLPAAWNVRASLFLDTHTGSQQSLRNRRASPGGASSQRAFLIP